MRILYVCSDFGIRPDGVKGASVHLRAITQALCIQGCDVALLSPREGPGGNHPAIRLLAPGSSPMDRLTKTLAEWLSRHDYHENIAGEIRSIFYNAWIQDHAVEAARLWQPDAVVERLSLFGHVGLDIAAALGVPFIVEVNAILTEEAAQFRSLQLQDLAEQMQHRVLAEADAVLAVSSPLADRLAFLGVARGKIHVIPNGVDFASFQAASPRSVCRAELGLPDAFTVGFSGSLKTWHGVDVLLAAFARLHGEDPSCRLLVVGEGPMERTLKADVDRLGLSDAVVFSGAVPHGRIPLLLRAMDVTTAPFKPVENFYFSPIKLFEYMASGACVVASRLGQIEEVVEDGVNGLLATPDDPEDLFAKLKQLRESESLRKQLAGNALRTVQEKYTWTHAALRTLSVIRGAIAFRLVRQQTDRADRSGVVAIEGSR